VCRAGGNSNKRRTFPWVTHKTNTWCRSHRIRDGARSIRSDGIVRYGRVTKVRPLTIALVAYIQLLWRSRHVRGCWNGSGLVKVRTHTYKTHVVEKAHAASGLTKTVEPTISNRKFGNERNTHVCRFRNRGSVATFLQRTGQSHWRLFVRAARTQTVLRKLGPRFLHALRIVDIGTGDSRNRVVISGESGPTQFRIVNT
jgi:hypothetical protein